jgi:hypothetical protein
MGREESGPHNTSYNRMLPTVSTLHIQFQKPGEMGIMSMVEIARV